MATPQVNNAPCATMRSWCVATFESPLDMVYRLSRGKDYLSEAWAFQKQGVIFLESGLFEKGGAGTILVDKMH